MGAHSSGKIPAKPDPMRSGAVLLSSAEQLLFSITGLTVVRKENFAYSLSLQNHAVFFFPFAQSPGVDIHNRIKNIDTQGICCRVDYTMAFIN